LNILSNVLKLSSNAVNIKLQNIKTKFKLKYKVIATMYAFSIYAN